MIRTATAVVLALTLTACAGGSDEPGSEDTSSDRPATDVTAQLETFDKENGITTADWYENVTDRTVANGALTVETDIVPDSDAEDIGSRICGAHTIFAAENDLSTVFVRGSDGQRIAKCGPGA